MNKLVTQEGHLCQSSSHGSYCPNIFSGYQNNVLEHNPDEEIGRFVQMKIVEIHSELACFSSFFVLISVFKDTDSVLMYLKTRSAF